MKIDLTGVTAIQAPVERNTKQVSAGTTAPVQDVTTDRTSFHSGSSSVASLVSQALATPDVRQAKVDSLRQAVSSGSYKVDADKIASAIIASDGN